MELIAWVSTNNRPFWGAGIKFRENFGATVTVIFTRNDQSFSIVKAKSSSKMFISCRSRWERIDFPQRCRLETLSLQRVSSKVTDYFTLNPFSMSEPKITSEKVGPLEYFEQKIRSKIVSRISTMNQALNCIFSCYFIKKYKHN